MIRSLLLCVLVGLAAPARAEDTRVEHEEVAVQAWGATHPECVEWSDACVVCRRAADEAACSTPGIACQPTATACRAR